MTEKPISHIAHDLQQRIFMLEKSLADLQDIVRDLQFDVQALYNKTKGNKRV